MPTLVFLDSNLHSTTLETSMLTITAAMGFQCNWTNWTVGKKIFPWFSIDMFIFPYCNLQYYYFYSPYIWQLVFEYDCLLMVKDVNNEVYTSSISVSLLSSLKSCLLLKCRSIVSLFIPIKAGNINRLFQVTRCHSLLYF